MLRFSGGRGWGGLMLAGLLGSASCAGGTSPEPVAGLETVEKFEAARLASYCRQLAPCCNPDGSDLDEASCLDRLGQYSGVLQRPSLSYDSRAAARCIEAYDRWLVGCSPRGAESIPLECEGVVVGNVPRGGACSDDRDCAPVGSEASRCRRQFDVTPPVAPYCEGDAAHSLRPHLEEGDACSGQCMPVPRGDACPGAADEPMCFVRDGLRCEAGACTPLGADGSPCRVDWLCASNVCLFSSGKTGEGVCHTPAQGTSCREDPDCLPPDYCATLPARVDANGNEVRPSVCQPRQATGEPCSEARECASNNCGQNGLCRAEPSIAACALLTVYPFAP